MKKLLFIALTGITLSVSAQKIQFFGGYEYYFNNRTKVVQPVPATMGTGGEMTAYHDMGEMCLIVGMKYRPVKFFEVRINTDTYFNPGKIDSYSPVQANYTVRADIFLTERIRIGFNHTCFHPVEVDGMYTQSKQFGGYRKIGVYFNM